MIFKLITLFAIFGFFKSTDSVFEGLICNYDLDSLSVEISKKDLVTGFEKIDNYPCTEDLRITSFWFTLIRDDSPSDVKVFKYEERSEIPNLLKSIKKGDVIDFTIICEPDSLERRSKMIKVKK